MSNRVTLSKSVSSPNPIVLLVALASCLLSSMPAFSADKMIQTRAYWMSVCPTDSPKGDKEGDKGTVGTTHTGVVGTLAVALAPKLIEGAVDAAAGALKAAGETKSTTATTRISADFYKTNNDGDLLVLPKCLVVVRGDFSATVGGTNELKLGQQEFAELKNIYFYLEARVNHLRGLKYFELVPNKLMVNKFDHWRMFGSSKRDYNVALTMTVPGGAAPFGSAEINFSSLSRPFVVGSNDWVLSSATSNPIQFPPESTDLAKIRAGLEGKNAPFLLALDILNPPKDSPGEPSSVYLDPKVRAAAKKYCDALVAVNKTREKERKKFDDRCDYMLDNDRSMLAEQEKIAGRNAMRKVWAHSVCTYVPPVVVSGVITEPAKCKNMPASDSIEDMKFTRFNTEVVLTESSEGSKFALYLGNALSASKEEVSNVLKDQIPKSEEVRDAENNAEAAAREATVVADLGVELAQAQLAEAQLPAGGNEVAVANARIALAKAKIAANEAHRKAGSVIPYPNLSAL